MWKGSNRIKSAETTDSNDAELCPCPKCDQGTIRIGESTYACDNPECKFRGLENVCKRDISEEEEEKSLLKENQTHRGLHF